MTTKIRHYASESYENDVNAFMSNFKYSRLQAEKSAEVYEVAKQLHFILDGALKQ